MSNRPSTPFLQQVLAAYHAAERLVGAVVVLKHTTEILADPPTVAQVNSFCQDYRTLIGAVGEARRLLEPVQTELTKTRVAAKMGTASACGEHGANAHEAIFNTGYTAELALLLSLGASDTNQSSVNRLSPENAGRVRQALDWVNLAELRELEAEARQGSILTLERLGAKHHLPELRQALFLAEEAVTPTEDTAVSDDVDETVLEVERWADLGIGIDEDGSYLAVTPCPECGSVFPKQKAVKLDLPGKQWPALLDLLARSAEGNTASKSEVMLRFGYLKRGDVSADSLEELKRDSAKMHMVDQARTRLTGAMGNLARRLRDQVKVASPEGPVLSVNEPEIVRAGFVVRHLFRGKDGKLRFGRNA